jgi:transposase-like protein
VDKEISPIYYKNRREAMSKEHRRYTKEFKQEAVQLYESSGKSMAEIKRDLGMSKGC